MGSPGSEEPLPTRSFALPEPSWPFGTTQWRTNQYADAPYAHTPTRFP